MIKYNDNFYYYWYWWSLEYKVFGKLVSTPKVSSETKMWGVLPDFLDSVLHLGLGLFL
jgi:hypothetical protein